MRLAQLIADNKDEILRTWEAKVRRIDPRAARLPKEQLYDDMPRFLDRLVRWLATDSTNTSDAVDHETTGSHALHRLHAGVELRTLLHEFRLLRQSIDAVIVQAGDALDRLAPDGARLADAIDHAMTESATTYAQTRDEGRELLLGILGHDLRNPLAAISMSAASLLKGGRLDEKAVRAVDRINRSVERVTRMVSDLLDLARSRFGVSMPVRPEHGDLGSIASHVFEELEHTHPTRALIFREQGSLEGDWDRQRLGQLVSNLLANAIEHGEDPIVLELDGRGPEVVIRVTNRGAPIPPDAIPSLFEAFRRPKREAESRTGLGLGLFIVGQIVRAHGGSVEVESGEETTFRVQLPRTLPQ